MFANCRGGFSVTKQDINAQTSSTMRVTAGWIRGEEACVSKMLQFPFSPIKLFLCFFVLCFSAREKVAFISS